MQNHSFKIMLKEDDDILLKIRREENAAFDLLYKFYFPSVAYYIQQNSGNTADAEDVFQETIIVLLQKTKESHFVLTASLKTYLFAIAKNIWLKRLRNSHLLFYEKIEIFEDYDFCEIEEEVEAISLGERISELMFRLSISCQRILRFSFWFGDSIETIMQKAGYKNKHSVSSQKNKCLDKMRELSEDTLKVE
jgi:RNA polymerase sigma factor (sigma-70 family)